MQNLKNLFNSENAVSEDTPNAVRELTVDEVSSVSGGHYGWHWNGYRWVWGGHYGGGHGGGHGGD